MIQSANLDLLFQAALTQIRDPRIREQLELIRQGKDSIELPDELTEENEETEELDEESVQNLSAAIREMSIPQKIKLALLGNMTARALLIRDTNWLVAGFVLQNPRLSENEVQEFSRNKDLDQAVFRTIASNATWMRSYSIKVAIVGNPKTPVDISIKWIKHLHDRDLRNLGKSRDIPQVLVGQCRKLMETRSKKTGN